MDGHNHLDRQVRTRGECPGCDLIWARQDARLADAQVRRGVIAQLDKMAERKPNTGGWCLAMKDQQRHRRGVETHTCGLRAHHDGPHRCPVCGIDWTR